METTGIMGNAVKLRMKPAVLNIAMKRDKRAMFQEHVKQVEWCCSLGTSLIGKKTNHFCLFLISMVVNFPRKQLVKSIEKNGRDVWKERKNDFKRYIRSYC